MIEYSTLSGNESALNKIKENVMGKPSLIRLSIPTLLLKSNEQLFMLVTSIMQLVFYSILLFNLNANNLNNNSFKLNNKVLNKISCIIKN
jgi:hypothetical protein